MEGHQNMVGSKERIRFYRAPVRCQIFPRFLDAQPDLPTKGRPRWVRLLADLDELPRTATTKVVKRELAAQGPVAGRGRLLERDERGTAYADVTEVTDVAEVLDQV